MTARVTLRSQDDASQVMLVVPTTGLSIAQTVGTPPVSTTTQSLTADDPDAGDDANNGVYEFTVNTAGAPAGDYVLTSHRDRMASSPAPCYALDRTADV